MRQLLLIMVFCPILLWGQLRPAKIFSDNMVLQREIDIPVWGSATPKELIRIEMAGESVSFATNEQGEWKVFLPKQEAGGPYTLKISGQSEVITFSDILIGDVWFASGQSNMEHPMQGWEWIPHSEIDRFDAEMADTGYPEIRLFAVPKHPSPVSLNDLPAGKWEKASKEAVAGFSATAWFFAKTLYKKLKVPIGIIHSSWGGTPIQTWMRRETLKPFINDLPRESDSLNPEEWYTKVTTSIEKNRIYRNQISYPPPGLAATISNPEVDLSGWEKIDFLNEEKHWGKVVWLRKTMIIPEVPSQPLKLSLGFLNRQANLYFNGIELAYIQYPKPAGIEVSPALIRKGENVLTIRLANFMGATQVFGTLSGSPNLEKQWLANDQLEQMDSSAESYQNRPAFLFNGMVAPVIPYGMKGIIWNQGESDAGHPALYEKMFQQLIVDWRHLWDQGDLPFLFVQSTSYMSIPGQKSFSRVKLRQAQAKALELPNTGMVVSIDIGDPYDVHPKNKNEIGRRLSLQALKIAYNCDITADGPVYRTHHISEDTVIVLFDHAAKGLRLINYNVEESFSVIAKDGKSYPVKAVVEDNKLLLYPMPAPGISEIHYAWEDYPVCTLFNSENLPSTPFRIIIEHSD